MLIYSSWSEVPVQSLPLRGALVDPALTLNCGQAFRWRLVEDDCWQGVALGRVWRLRFDLDAIEFQVVPSTPDAGQILAAYFRTDVDLDAILTSLLARDDPFAEAARRFPGLRVLAQEPIETLLTFICSGANNIIRITKSINRLCRAYGAPIARIGDETFHDFPTLERLAAAEPLELRFAADLGFRAKALRGTARRLLELGPAWPEQVRSAPFEAAQAALLTLPGVGLKIADCALLFGFGHDEAVPVDTHIRAAVRDLLCWDFGTRSLTDRTYRAIGTRFRDRYGHWAGWAQQYLFHLHRARARGELPVLPPAPQAD